MPAAATGWTTHDATLLIFAVGIRRRRLTRRALLFSQSSPRSSRRETAETGGHRAGDAGRERRGSARFGGGRGGEGGVTLASLCIESISDFSALWISVCLSSLVAPGRSEASPRAPRDVLARARVSLVVSLSGFLSFVAPPRDERADVRFRGSNRRGRRRARGRRVGEPRGRGRVARRPRPDGARGPRQTLVGPSRAVSDVP